MNNEMLINEGGINWNWFTRLRIESDDTVIILEHYRKPLGEFTAEEKDAINHPEYYGRDIWNEAEGRIAIKYNVPRIGWKVIKNPEYIFSYTKKKPETPDEAKAIIEQIAEEKKSMLEIIEFVDKSADKKLKETNPECYLIREQIYEEDLFSKLKNKIEEKKKLTNYPNARSKEEYNIHINIQTLEHSLYDTYQIPLFKLGLAENLSKGFDWIIDEIILSYARFNEDVKEGEKAVRELFPSDKSYILSEDAKEFINFLICERDDYKIFAMEFIKKMCEK
jgi:hypothetical protein